MSIMSYSQVVCLHYPRRFTSGIVYTSLKHEILEYSLFLSENQPKLTAMDVKIKLSKLNPLDNQQGCSKSGSAGAKVVFAHKHKSKCSSHNWEGKEIKTKK